MNSFANPDASHLDVLSERSRPSADFDIKIHRYLPVAAFYFFFNHAGLPSGLFYTTLFSPFLFLWLYLKGRRWLTAKYLLVLLPFILAHMVLGIPDPLNYLRTLIHWWTVYVAVYAICWALRKCESLDRLFEQLILLNFYASIFALAILPTPLRGLLWTQTVVITGTSASPRLSLFAHEPSAYAELVLPLLIFAVLRLLSNRRMRSAVYLMMIVLPVLLCQSFGGISIGMAGICVALMTGYRRFLTESKSRLIFFCLTIPIGALLLTPNPISLRVLQVLAGNDGSTQARTILSYIASYVVASSKSIWWGVGLGQMKLMDISYLHFGLINGVPNMMAGIFAEFGLIGVTAMVAVEIYLFFKTRVYLNSFRLAMFVMAFLQQATGSYGTDVQQYLTWFLAFFPCFPEYNLRDVIKSEGSRL